MGRHFSYAAGRHIAKIKLGELGLKTGRSILAGFETGRQVIRRAYWQDGKNYPSIRRRCHRCICGDLRRDGPEGQTSAQMTHYTAPEAGGL